MKVLSIGFTRGLLNTDELTDDTFRRLSYYAEKIDQYTVLVHTIKSSEYQTRQISDNFTVIPSNGVNRIHSFLKLLKIGHRCLSEEDYDVIQTQDPIYTGPVGALLKVYHGVPLNVCIYGPNVYDRRWLNEHWSHNFLTYLGRLVLRYSDGIQLDGTKTKDDLAELGYSPESLRVQPMVPVNQDQFLTAGGESVREELLNDNFDRMVLFVGRLVPQKNISKYLDIIERVTKVHPRTLFVIVGEGEKESHLKRKAATLGVEDNIRWIDRIPHEQISQYFAAADLFALPSLYEGFARVLMEAAMAGTAIVTMDVSGADDAVISGGNGYISDDYTEFEDHLIELLENPGRAHEMGERGRDYMEENFDYEQSLDKQVQIWEDLSQEIN